MNIIYKKWWKILAVVLISYTLIAGILGPVPALPILNETIRNVYFHVPMWMAMFTVFLISVVYSIKYLSTGKEEYDLIAVECVNTGVIFFALGLVTGMFWAYVTWGEAWSNDPKQNSAAITSLVYCAYLVLRNSVDEEQKRARISSIYNIFAFPIMIVLLKVLPSLTDSLHPGNGGNPGFSTIPMSDNIRMVLYPAFIGWSLLGVWIASIRYRIRILENKINK
jgi:heme exporter protein C